MNNEYDTIIIGAGMSGLAAGIRLAHFDQRVCILERHYTIGGLNSFYRLGGRDYDVGLHAKAAVVDREHVFIGSFNFSPRSRNLNLEMGILVHSVEFGQQAAAVMDRIMAPDNAWQLALDESILGNRRVLRAPVPEAFLHLAEKKGWPTSVMRP